MASAYVTVRWGGDEFVCAMSIARADAALYLDKADRDRGAPWA